MPPPPPQTEDVRRLLARFEGTPTPPAGRVPASGRQQREAASGAGLAV